MPQEDNFFILLDPKVSCPSVQVQACLTITENSKRFTFVNLWNSVKNNKVANAKSLLMSV